MPKGDGETQIVLAERWRNSQYPIGLIMTLVGSGAAAGVMRDPRLATFFSKAFLRGAFAAKFRFAGACLLIPAGATLLGSQNMYAALLRGTPYAWIQPPTDRQQIANWWIGTGMLSTGLYTGFQALIRGVGLHGLPVGLVGRVPQIFMAHILLSSAAGLMGVETSGSEWVRALRREPRIDTRFAYDDQREMINTVLGLGMFIAGLYVFRTGQFASTGFLRENIKFFQRLRYSSYGLVTLSTGLSLAEAPSVLPRLFGLPDREPVFDPSDVGDWARGASGVVTGVIGVMDMRRALQRKDMAKLLRFRYGFSGTVFLLAATSITGVGATLLDVWMRSSEKTGRVTEQDDGE